jgi:MFS family permease
VKRTITLTGKALSRVAGNLRQFFRHPVARAIGLTFAVDSLMFGSWVTHIPHVKNRLQLNDAELGLALFGLPLGLLVMNPLSPRLLARFGLATATVGSTLALLLAFSLPLLMPDRWTLMAALFLVGLAVALMNVAMNTCATSFEQSRGMAVMSSCHGMWSLGGMVGSGLSAAMIAAGLAPAFHLAGLAVLLGLLTWTMLRPALLQVPEARPAPVEPSVEGLTTVRPARFAWPNRDLLLMIFIGFCVSLCEGLAFDWSAVYLHDDLGAPGPVAALAFTGFSLTMMAMRFTGDVLIPRFGESRLLLGSAALSLLALLTIMLAVNPPLGLLGFLLLGAGVALGAPILFNAAARVPGLAPGAGLATYATYSFIGFLAGPPLIGWIGEARSLPLAFGLVGILVLMSVWAIRKVRL